MIEVFGREQVIVDDEVKEYIRQNKLEEQFEFSKSLLCTTFETAPVIRISLLEAPDGFGSCVTICANVSTTLDRKTFRNTKKIFYRALRNKNVESIREVLSVIRS